MKSINDIAKITDKKKLIEGTAVEFKDNIEWSIELPKRKYDVKIFCKVVDNLQSQEEFKDKKINM